MQITFSTEPQCKIKKIYFYYFSDKINVNQGCKDYSRVTTIMFTN